MPRLLRPIACLVILLSLSVLGCAGLRPGYDPPSVTVSSFRALPGKGAAPRFEIGLHIINPNREPLDLKGVAYTVTIEGHKILTGVSNELPKIEAYGEGDVLLQAGVDLFSSILFFTDMAKKGGREQLSYTLEAKLDVGALYPVIRVDRKGSFSLKPGQMPKTQ
jgi:LEA14-like dessication related protein